MNLVYLLRRMMGKVDVFTYRDGPVPFTGKPRRYSRYRRYAGVVNDGANLDDEFVEDDNDNIVKVPGIRKSRKQMVKNMLGEGKLRHCNQTRNWKSHRNNQWK